MTTAREIHLRGNARAVKAAELRRAGLKLREIGEVFGGLHISTAASLVAKGQNILARRALNSPGG